MILLYAAVLCTRYLILADIFSTEKSNNERYARRGYPAVTCIILGFDFYFINAMILYHLTRPD